MAEIESTKKIACIIENNRIERLYIADYWKQAKKWCVKEGYDFIDDDPSKELYKSLMLEK